MNIIEDIQARQKMAAEKELQEKTAAAIQENKEQKLFLELYALLSPLNGGRVTFKNGCCKVLVELKTDEILIYYRGWFFDRARFRISRDLEQLHVHWYDPNSSGWRYQLCSVDKAYQIIVGYLADHQFVPGNL